MRLAILLALLALFLLLWWWQASIFLRSLLALLNVVGDYLVVAQLRRLWARRAYSLAREAAHDAFWEWNPLSKRLKVGARLLEILGYNENFLPDTHSRLDLVHPDDRAHYKRRVADHLKGGSP